jgi:dihydrofolate reductase
MAKKAKMPSISYIVARSVPDHIIGCDNKLPWHLRTDMKNFKMVTTNSVVIMGRKTFDSIGRPLPNRINIVVSSTAAASVGDAHFVQSKESALYLADYFSILADISDVFVIGGGTIYQAFQRQFNKVYLTEVHAKGLRGDSYFDYRFSRDRWRLLDRREYPSSEVDEFPFTISTYIRRNKRNRARALSEFLKPAEHLHGWELKRFEQVDLGLAIKRISSEPKLKC